MAGLTAAKPSGDSLSPEAIESKMHLPTNMVKPFKAIIVAGLKIMFDDKTHQQMMQQLQGPGEMSQKLGQGIARLMNMLFQESQRSLPPQMVIPAGMVLMAHAVKFLNEAGMTVTPEEFGQAVEVMIGDVLKGFGVDAAKVGPAMDQMAAKGNGNGV